MITELGNRCQEMARIEDFASFKSENSRLFIRLSEQMVYFSVVYYKLILFAKYTNWIRHELYQLTRHGRN
jgi:hypothetical protein